MPLSQTFPQIKTSKWVSHSTALKLRTHWVQPNSNYELIEYQWVRVHSKFCTQLRLHSNYELIECSRTQITNSLIISEFVCTQSFALKLRTHWVQPHSNCELIEYQWVRMHSKFRTQLQPHSNCELIDYQWVRMHSKFCAQTTNSLSAAELKLRTHWLLVSSSALKVSHSTALKKWINLNLSFQSLPNSQSWLRLQKIFWARRFTISSINPASNSPMIFKIMSVLLI